MQDSATASRMWRVYNALSAKMATSTSPPVIQMVVNVSRASPISKDTPLIIMISEDAPLIIMISEDAPLIIMISEDAPLIIMISEDAPLIIMFNEDAPLIIMISKDAPLIISGPELSLSPLL